MVGTLSMEPYSQYSKDELLLRDYLAADRTVLANERTLLSYVRTALTLLIAGVTSLHFIAEPNIRLLGVVSLILAGVILVIGTFRYWKMKKMIDSIKKAGKNHEGNNAEQPQHR